MASSTSERETLAISGAAIGATVGALVGSLFGTIGIAVGAFFGATIGGAARLAKQNQSRLTEPKRQGIEPGN